MESNQNVEIVVPAKQSFATEWASDQKACKGVPAKRGATVAVATA